MANTQPRMSNIAMIVPDAMQALRALKASAEKGGVPARTLDLVELRASQIHGCSVCVDMHARHLKKEGETDERLFAVAAWRDAPWFTDAERAALALTEADGPYVEVKDSIQGYMLLEAKDIDQAVELARGCPILEGDGTVEVRPIGAS